MRPPDCQCDPCRLVHRARLLLGAAEETALQITVTQHGLPADADEGLWPLQTAGGMIGAVNLALAGLVDAVEIAADLVCREGADDGVG